MLAAVARAKGVSAYVGDGQNLWPAVHRHDSARVYCLALERGAQGKAYHAIAEEGVPFRLIAEAIGGQLGVPAKSLTVEEAEAHFGGLAMWVSGNGPASNTWTSEVLGWTPREVGIIADIGRPNYTEKLVRLALGFSHPDHPTSRRRANGAGSSSSTSASTASATLSNASSPS